jgi:hypothetical protein
MTIGDIMAMRAPKFQAPNLENATPSMLIDELAKLSIIQNYAKKLRDVYKTALFARLNFDPKKPLKGQLELNVEDLKHAEKGEKFIGTIEQYGQDRFDTAAFKADHPDLYAKYCKASTITKVTYDLNAPNVFPELAKLMAEIKAELDLED